MSTNENIKTISVYYAAFNRHEVARMLNFYSETAILKDIALTWTLKGKEAIRTRFQQYLTAFPDLRFDITNLLATGDWVVSEWQAHGTHQSMWMGIPPSYNEFLVAGSSLFRLVDKRIHLNNVYWDFYRLLKQLGAVDFPTPSRSLAA